MVTSFKTHQTLDVQEEAKAEDQNWDALAHPVTGILLQEQAQVLPGKLWRHSDTASTWQSPRIGFGS